MIRVEGCLLLVCGGGLKFFGLGFRFEGFMSVISPSVMMRRTMQSCHFGRLHICLRLV
jgi:hypothetical protein